MSPPRIACIVIVLCGLMSLGLGGIGCVNFCGNLVCAKAGHGRCNKRTDDDQKRQNIIIATMDALLEVMMMLVPAYKARTLQMRASKKCIATLALCIRPAGSCLAFLAVLAMNRLSRSHPERDYNAVVFVQISQIWAVLSIHLVSWKDIWRALNGFDTLGAPIFLDLEARSTRQAKIAAESTDSIVHGAQRRATLGDSSSVLSVGGSALDPPLVSAKSMDDMR